MRSLQLVIAFMVALTTMVVGQTHLIIVTGLGGDEAHRSKFHSWAATFREAAITRFEIDESNIVYLAENPELDPSAIDGVSTKENILESFRSIASRIGPEGELFVLLIGHGSYQGEESKFSLPGPDMTAADFAEALEFYPLQKIAFVNTASAGGDFVQALSRERRTIVSATRSPTQRNETVFCRYFVQAFTEDVADVDHDERISLLEAFLFARSEVARFYESDNRLQTEHALLDDNGDGVGSEEPTVSGDEGGLAAAFFLNASPAVTEVSADDDPELAALYERQRELQDQIAELRARREQVESSVYERELEGLLIDLARIAAEIRERGGGTGGG